LEKSFPLYFEWTCCCETALSFVGIHYCSISVVHLPASPAWLGCQCTLAFNKWGTHASLSKCIPLQHSFLFSKIFKILY
jgi:hypothetical protein